MRCEGVNQGRGRMGGRKRPKDELTLSFRDLPGPGPASDQRTAQTGSIAERAIEERIRALQQARVSLLLQDIDPMTFPSRYSV